MPLLCSSPGNKDCLIREAPLAEEEGTERLPELGGFGLRRTGCGIS